MKERPILFSGEMVRAILDGRKTQTRRVVKPQPDCDSTHLGHIGSGPCVVLAMREGMYSIPCPYGRPSDRLWVQETFYCDDWRYPNAPIAEMKELLEYRATHDCSNWEAGCPCQDENGKGSWRPSIHMPRWASRITLEIVSVRVERLQEISGMDALCEGCPHHRSTGFSPADAVNWYRTLWDSINAAKHPWDSNPWVWVIEFKRL